MNINIANLILDSHFISIVSNSYVKISFLSMIFEICIKHNSEKTEKHLITN